MQRTVRPASRRWEKWQAKTRDWDPERRAEDREAEMARLGIAKRAGFVTWGFVLDEREDDDGTSTVTLLGWANENSSNCHISGEDGELTDLHSHFPELEYDVEYTDDYSSGFCVPPHFDKQEREG